MLGRRSVVICAGIAVSAVFIWLALRGLDLAELATALGNVQLLPWLPIALGIFSLAYLLRGVRCRLLVKQHADIDVLTSTNIVLVGYAASNVLPARLGELVRIGMLAERANMPVSQSVGVTFVERVLDGLALLFLLIVSTLTVDVPGWMDELVYIAGGIFGLATIVMLLGALWPRFVIGLSIKVGGIVSPTLGDKLGTLAVNVTNAAACLRNPKQAALLIAYSIVIWTFESAIYVFLLPAFGLPLSVQAGMITMCVTGFGLLLPSSPGFIGPFHFFASKALMVFGVAHSTALAYASLVHLAFFIPVTVAGGFAVFWYGVKLSATAARVRQAVQSEAPAVANSAATLESA